MQALGKKYETLESILCDLVFIYRKCTLGLATQLLEDYQPTGNRDYSKWNLYDTGLSICALTNHTCKPSYTLAL